MFISHEVKKMSLTELQGSIENQARIGHDFLSEDILIRIFMKAVRIIARTLIMGVITKRDTGATTVISKKEAKILKRPRRLEEEIRIEDIPF